MAFTNMVARTACASAMTLAATLASAHAATLVGLTADNRLVKIDTTTLAASTPMAVAGADALVGIDVRPADGRLYGLTANGQLVVIDHASGKATAVSTLSEKVALGARPVVDFNPVADRLRVVGADGVSLRINVDTGATIVDKPLNYDPADASAGKKPGVAAGAYTNSAKGAKATELFHVDGGTGALVLQNPPNDGVLKTRGMVALDRPSAVVMDIESDGDGKNTAWLIADGTLYTIDLATGKTAKVGALKGMTGTLVDIAVMN